MIYIQVSIYHHNKS